MRMRRFICPISARLNAPANSSRRCRAAVAVVRWADAWLCRRALPIIQAFVRSELPIREALLYPPFGSIVRIVVRSVNEQAVANWAEHIADQLRVEVATRANPVALRVLGPAPAPITRLRDRFRWHLQVQGPDGEILREIVSKVTASLKNPDNVAWIVDVDPVEML